MPIQDEQLNRIKENINQQRQSLEQWIRPYKQRIVAVTNERHPSMFKMSDEQNKVTVATIGPYRRRCQVHTDQPGKTQPPIISDDKKWCFVGFLQRYDLSIKHFLEWAEENNDRARACYEPGTIDMDQQEFGEMLLKDGSMLLFAIYNLRSSVQEDKGPAKLSLSWTQNSDPNGEEFIFLSVDILLHMNQLRLDLLMLNNQIPFFVLDKLHHMTRDTLFKDINHSIQEMALSCFDQVHPKPTRGWGRSRGDNFPTTVHHLLHLFHWSRVPHRKYTIDNPLIPKDPKFNLPSANDLRETAIIFKKTSSSCQLDISFSSRIGGVYGVMSIPALYLYDYSESIFRNLIAFEQKHIRCGHGVTAYCIQMARLLPTEADVKLLRSKRILPRTPMTDKEIVNFFRKLGDDYNGTFIPEDLTTFDEVVSGHLESRLAMLTGETMLQYFPSRLITFVVICGLLITAVTLANNIRNFYSVYHPMKP